VPRRASRCRHNMAPATGYSGPRASKKSSCRADRGKRLDLRETDPCQEMEKASTASVKTANFVACSFYHFTQGQCLKGLESFVLSRWQLRSDHRHSLRRLLRRFDRACRNNGFLAATAAEIAAKHYNEGQVRPKKTLHGCTIILSPDGYSIVELSTC